jgi:hypothetical protein
MQGGDNKFIKGEWKMRTKKRLSAKLGHRREEDSNKNGKCGWWVVAGCCKRGNELSDFMQNRGFIDKASSYKVFEMVYASRHLYNAMHG